MDTFAVGLLTTVLVHLVNAAAIVQEVDHGQIAILHCPSNDNNHRFQYWHLEHTNQFIGPGNDINKQKYKYEVLTGTLFINAVSTSETGRYTCFCRHVGGSQVLRSETIELVVRRDWEEVYETDPTTNMFRIALLLGVSLILLVLLFILYNMRPSRAALFRELTDEESPDEGPVPTYKMETTLQSTNNPFSRSNMDNIALDTELPKAINATVHNTNESAI